MNQIFELPAELSIYTVADTHRRLQVWLGQQIDSAAAQLQLLAHGVEEIDGAGFQLLGALANSVAALGVPLRVVAPSRTFVETSATLGCIDWFDVTEQAAAREVA
ncbi:MAG: STAS domain-containing protein [Pseudomonadota bacterium]|uniref:STAS domain-containing protein n=1 Tax=Methyloversatilis sp. TaxID=2569862 RepID=UPI002732E804|nr:STAS domain-containing protein [Methyloversatilis sp.]MDP3871478.1 STAS domain-containing protein [Methyloversatilis sp.]